jgi:hypothetical protein
MQLGYPIRWWQLQFASLILYYQLQLHIGRRNGGGGTSAGVARSM